MMIQTAADVTLPLSPMYAVDSVCMTMGFPVVIAFSWDSHGNGNEKQISMGVGMTSVGVRILKNIWFRNSHLLSDLS